MVCPFRDTSCLTNACMFYDGDKVQCKIVLACDNMQKLVEFLAYMEAEQEEKERRQEEKERHGL